MNRLSIIQKIINHKRNCTYLEIGLGSGNNFYKIRARKKIGVDPNLKIKKKKFRLVLKNRWNIFNKYYEMDSNGFFKNKSDVLIKYNGLDVVFIDGLHTFEQSLRDVQNCLKFLKENGVIIMHDCNPPSELAALPAQSYEEVQNLNLTAWTGDWCGDVWKTIAYLRSTQKDLNVFVLDYDYGIGIITKGKPEEIIEYKPEEIKNFSYKDLNKNRKTILNLKFDDYLNDFLTNLEDKKEDHEDLNH